MSVIVKLIQQSDTSNTHLKNLQEYIAKPDAKQESGLDVWYFNSIDDNSAQAEMLALNEANCRARNTYKHLLISFSPDVFPTRSQAREASSLLLKEMGLYTCVSMVGMHYDQDHIHLHVAVVSINPETFESVHAEWAVEAMHRAAAKINYLQGWKPQENQLYSIINVNEEGIAIRNSNKGRTLKANEVSTFHGQRPAADIAAELVKLALKDKRIDNWEKFHRALADNGIEYQKKSSGSIYLIEQSGKQVKVKASVVNRNATMKLLEMKYGPYVSNIHGIAKRKIEPVKGMNNEVKLWWDKFQEVKLALVKIKSIIANQQRVEFQNLSKQQLTQRLEFIGLGWKGRGSELNKARMIMAAQQAQQKSKLKQEQLTKKLEEIKKFHAQCGSTSRFDDYLRFHDISLLTQHKEQQRQLRIESKIFPGASEVEPNHAYVIGSGIEAYQFHQKSVSTKLGQSFILKFSNHDGRVDFTDEGKRIKVINVDRDSVRAFLQLSNQKWKLYELTGSLEFKYLCAEEAIKLGLPHRIKNQNVQKMIASIKRLKEIKKNGARSPVFAHKSWNKPIYVELRPLKNLTVMKVSGPTSREQITINSYLIHAEDIGAKPKNDYFRDFEVAIRLHATGYSFEEISHAISKASPVVVADEVHSGYAKHLIAAINSPSAREVWKDIIAEKVHEWTALTQDSAKSQFIPRNKP